jgi:hypothetical protein
MFTYQAINKGLIPAVLPNGFSPNNKHMLYGKLIQLLIHLRPCLPLGCCALTIALFAEESFL